MEKINTDNITLNSPIGAYWLGIMFSCGTLRATEFSMQKPVSDTPLFTAFKNYFEFEGNTSKIRDKDGNIRYERLTVRNQDFIAKLYSYGINNRLTGGFRLPDGVTINAPALIQFAFIRGMFEGGGSYKFRTGKTIMRPEMVFQSHSSLPLEQIRIIINSKILRINDLEKPVIRCRESLGIYKLGCTLLYGEDFVNLILNDLYSSVLLPEDYTCKKSKQSANYVYNFLKDSRQKSVSRSIFSIIESSKENDGYNRNSSVFKQLENYYSETI